MLERVGRRKKRRGRGEEGRGGKRGKGEEEGKGKGQERDGRVEVRGRKEVTTNLRDLTKLVGELFSRTHFRFFTSSFKILVHLIHLICLVKKKNSCSEIYENYFFLFLKNHVHLLR
jgi:hypothetical protein